MKNFFCRALVGAVLAGSAIAGAQTTDHSHHAPASPAAAQTLDFSEGEVRKLDLDTGKVTLKHGPIKSLDMPPMTMVFNADKALLTPLKVGDKVRFKVVHEGGKYVVTAIQP
jgi:Cu/Ag efflux protein CusF